jgi:hypothetical protein
LKKKKKARELETKRQQHLGSFFAGQFRQDQLRTTIDLHGQTVASALQVCKQVSNCYEFG